MDALVVEANATAPSLDDEALRRWLTDLPCCASAADGRPGDPLNVVLVGNLDAIRAALVSRHWDVTARLTARSGWQMAKDTTHVIAPDIDDFRYYLVEDLLYGGRVRQIGFVGGVGRASLRSPRRNAEDAPYFTDGLRAVLFLSADVVPFSRIKLLDWELPAFMKPFAPGDSETRSARTDAAGGD